MAEQPGLCQTWLKIPKTDFLTTQLTSDSQFQVDLAKRKQLQEAKQEAWEREIKMQTQPLKMISLGCVWEGETTAIAARQLEKLLSFKVSGQNMIHD